MRSVVIVSRDGEPIWALPCEDESAMIHTIKETYAQYLRSMTDEELSDVFFEQSCVHINEEIPMESEAGIIRHQGSDILIRPVPMEEPASLSRKKPADTKTYHFGFLTTDLEIEPGDCVKNLSCLWQHTSGRNEQFAQATILEIRQNHILFRDDTTDIVFCVKPEQIGGTIWEET